MTRAIKMQKSLLRIFAVLVAMAMTFLMLPIRSLAATKTYTVTFGAGSVAKFDKSVVDAYIETYGEENVAVSKATGNIKITVEAGAATPDAPDAVVFNADAKDKYVIDTTWRPRAEKVTENATYVVKYNRLTSGVEYTVKYVDAESGMQLAVPVIVLGNIDSTVSYTAKNIDGYNVDAQTASLKLGADAKKNVITFRYTAIPAPQQGQPAQQQAQQPAQQGQVAGEQYENNAANANNGNATASSTATEGEDEGEVLGAKYENTLNRYFPFVIGGIVIVMAGAMVVLVVTKNKADKIKK